MGINPKLENAVVTALMRCNDYHRLQDALIDAEDIIVAICNAGFSICPKETNTEGLS